MVDTPRIGDLFVVQFWSANNFRLWVGYLPNPPAVGDVICISGLPDSVVNLRKWYPNTRTVICFTDYTVDRSRVDKHEFMPRSD